MAEGCKLEAGMKEALTEADAMMVAPNRALASHAIIAVGDSEICNISATLLIQQWQRKTIARSG